MDDGNMQRSRVRDECGSGGYAMDFSSSFRRSKRARSRDLSSEEEKESSAFVSDSAHRHNASLLPSMTTEFHTNPWRLPMHQTLQDTQQYLNDQLQHVVALSSLLAPCSTKTFLTQEKAIQDDVESVCTLDLATLWEMLAVGVETQTSQQKTAEKCLRNVLDLVSYLLYVRDRELEHQNRLSEDLSKVEKKLERKNHIVRTLTSDLEALKQTFAQRENTFKAKEQALMTERKMLQMEKKALEVNCARLQGVETAYKAQLRRKDVEYARLRKSLQDVVARAAKEKRGMTIAKTLNGVHERKQVSVNSQSKESKLTKQIMENLERKKAELLFDNEALGKSYDTLQHHLESLTSQYKKAVQLFLAQKNLDGDSEELEKLASAPIDHFTPIPFNMATKAGIPEFISQSMETLDEKLKQLEHVIRNEIPSAEARSDKEVIKRLRQKLEDAHGLIKEQDQLLQASLSVPAKDLRVSHHHRFAVKARVERIEGCRSSLDVSAEEDLTYEKRELAVLRQNLQKERKLLQEEATKLDQDRLEFEILKRDQLFGSSDEMSYERSQTTLDGAKQSTPTQERQTKSFDANGSNSPFDIPVSASPGTAALLKKIGINVPSETS